METNKNYTKLAGMILILCSEKELSRTSLNKLLFFSELTHYLIFNNLQISNIPYLKMQYGPVPLNIDNLRKELIRSNFLIETQYDNGVLYFYDYTTNAEHKHLVENIKKKIFSPNENLCMDLVLTNLIHMNASELSEISHQYEPWKSADWFQELDFAKANKDAQLKDWMSQIGLFRPTAITATSEGAINLQADVESMIAKHKEIQKSLKQDIHKLQKKAQHKKAKTNIESVLT